MTWLCFACCSTTLREPFTNIDKSPAVSEVHNLRPMYGGAQGHSSEGSKSC